MRKVDYPTCAQCPGPVCNSKDALKGPDFCPTRTQGQIIAKSEEKYCDELYEAHRVSTVVEGQSYAYLPWAPDVPSPMTTRLEETMRFAEMMGYHRLGVAFCMGLRNETKVLVSILENRGFEVVSVCCKNGGVPKEKRGVKEEEKITPGKHESLCNPISQAEILNHHKCDFNILVGLCVGHDALFLKHTQALTTVFIVKDRLLGHNPIAAIYQSKAYYRRLTRKPKEV